MKNLKEIAYGKTFDKWHEVNIFVGYGITTISTPWLWMAKIIAFIFNVEVTK
jgi:hypothetical protein